MRLFSVAVTTFSLRSLCGRRVTDRDLVVEVRGNDRDASTTTVKSPLTPAVRTYPMQSAAGIRKVALCLTSGDTAVMVAQQN